jgi:RNA polymerase sigma-70 factor (ECF subfamily)
MVFEEIYNSNFQRIYRLCIRYLNDDELAKDTVQDVFIIVMMELPKFRNKSMVGTWIFRIAVNECMDVIRKQKRLPKSELSNDLVELPLYTDDVTQYDILNRMRLLDTYIDELSDIERIIILLQFEQLHYSEIAVIVSLTPGNVRVRLHRIKEKLFQKFKQSGRLRNFDTTLNTENYNAL